MSADAVAGRTLAAGTATLACTTIVAGALTPHYSPASETISRLAAPGAPYALVVQAVIVLYGASVVLWSRSLVRVDGAYAAPLRWACTTYGAAAVITGAFPKNLPDTAVTPASQFHVLAAIVAGAAIILAMLIVAVGHDDPDVARLSAAAAGASTFGVAVFKLTWGTTVYGAVERGLVGGAAAWLLLIAAAVRDFQHEHSPQR